MHPRETIICFARASSKNSQNEKLDLSRFDAAPLIACTATKETDVVSKEDLGLAQENDLLRRENRILKEGRDILKKATQFFASQKPLSHM